MKQNTLKLLRVAILLVIVSLACQVFVPSAKELQEDLPSGENAVPEGEIVEESENLTDLPDLMIYGWASMRGIKGKVELLGGEG